MQILKIAEFECSSCFLAVFSPNLHEDILLLCIGGLVHEDILLLRIVVVIGGFLGCRRVAFAFEFVALIKQEFVDDFDLTTTVATHAQCGVLVTVCRRC